ncbi:MAG: serine hydrolase domain-containing protein [Bacteroidia bacterium]
MKQVLKVIAWVMGILTLAVLVHSCGQASGTGSAISNHPVSIIPKLSVTLDTASLSAEQRMQATRLDTLFLGKVKRNHFNGNVLIAHKGKVIYEKCFGFEDYKSKKELTRASAFQLASSSKPMTAAAIMVLKEKGKLNYEDGVKKYFPDFPYEGITIRMLLNHRSGLPNYEYFTGDYVADHDTPISNEEILKIMAEHKPAVYSKPGKHFSYNNSNYLLLALIIEKASGMNYRTFLQKEIFDPCGMTSTYIPDRKKDTLRLHETHNYAGAGKWTPAPFNCLDGVLGDKGVYSTMEDLYRFERAVSSCKLLKKETLDEAYKGGSNEKAGKRNYGFGWRLTEQPDGSQVIYHNGWWHGYNSVFMRRPKDEAVVIVLCNKYNTNIYHVQGVWEILDGEKVSVEEKPEE